MSQTVIDKLNRIYDTKLQIKSILGTDSDVFEQYPSYISALASNSGVSYAYLEERLSQYVDISYLNSLGYITGYVLDNASYATITYVNSYVYTYAPDTIDLSPYVTKNDLSIASYITPDYLNDAGYISGIPSYYATYDAIFNMSFATESYVVDYVSTHGGGGGSGEVSYAYLNDRLSDYVSYSYGNANYVSYSYLGDLEEITYYILGSSSSSAPENVYATKTELATYATKSYVADYVNTYASSPDLSAYVSKTELSSCGYISSIPSDYATYTAIEGMGYVTSNDLPIIDESIASKTNDTYSLGSSSYYYNTVFTNRLQGNSSVNIRTNNNNRVSFTNSGFRPMLANYDLGSADYPWKNTYTTYINSYAVTDFATKSYVVDYVNTYAPSLDLSSYVTYTYMYAYVGYVVGDIETLLSNI